MKNSKDLKTFLVNDDLFILSNYAQILRSLGYGHITTFKSGTDCLNQLTEKPDVIFLDCNFDTPSGFDLLKKIRHLDPNIYVVMVSGQEYVQKARESLKYGAFA